MKGGKRFSHAGILAIEPSALDVVFELETASPPRLSGTTAIVPIRGPLCTYAGQDWCDSYEGIIERVRGALDAGARAVVLDFDSPGGIAMGMIDAAVSVRAMADARGARLVAHAQGLLCSAAYGLAATCHEIVTSATAIVGSVGVVEVMTSASRQAQALGLDARVVGSGKRKGDTHPASPLADDAVAATQERVDALASVFFDHVAKHRGVSASAIAALEAGVFVGARAVDVGLADRVGSLDEVIASLAASGAPSTEREAMDEDKIREALAALAEDDTKDEAARAKARAALKAMSGEDEEAEKEPEAKAEEPAKPADEDEKPEAKASASYASRAELDALRADVERERKSALFASRPDLPKALRAQLEAMPFAQAKGVVDAMPKAAPTHAATAVVSGIRGSAKAAAEDSPQRRAMAIAMGLETEKTGVVDLGHKLILGGSI